MQGLDLQGEITLMDKSTFQILRPVLLTELFVMDERIIVSDETLKCREAERESYEAFMDSLSEVQHDMYCKYESIAHSSWASEEEDYFVLGMIEGVKKSVEIDPSVIIKLLQNGKAVS
jgi:hypothetical protein